MQSHAFNKMNVEQDFPNGVPAAVSAKLNELESEIIKRDALFATILVGLFLSGTVEAMLISLSGGSSAFQVFTLRVASIIFPICLIADKYDLGGRFVASSSNYTLISFCEGLRQRCCDASAGIGQQGNRNGRYDDEAAHIKTLDDELKRVKQDNKCYQNPNTTAAAIIAGIALPMMFDVKSAVSSVVDLIPGELSSMSMVSTFTNIASGALGFVGAALFNGLRGVEQEHVEVRDNQPAV